MRVRHLTNVKEPDFSFAGNSFPVPLSTRAGFCHERSSAKAGVREFFWKGRGETYFCKKWFPRSHKHKTKIVFYQINIYPIMVFCFSIPAPCLTRAGFCHERSSAKAGVREFFWKGRGETYFCKKWFPRTQKHKTKIIFSSNPHLPYYEFLSFHHLRINLDYCDSSPPCLRREFFPGSPLNKSRILP